MSVHSEDGECSQSPKREDLVEVLDNGSFVLDRNDDAADVVMTSDEPSPKEDGEQSDGEMSSQVETKKKTNWMKNAMASVMSLNDDEPSKKPEPKKDNRWKPQCFNCLGEHTMAACTVPKDFRKIRENRDAFNAAKQSKDAARYSEASSSAGQFKPGRISDALQKALGIGPNDIPEYIYRMRKMGFHRGYPPGHLKSAIVQPAKESDVFTFHSDNPDLSGRGEEGECKDEEEERPSSPTINPEKINYYFGFNQTYRALRDRESHYRVPPFDDFVKFLTQEVKKDYWETRRREERKRKTAPMENGAGAEGKRARLDSDCVILPPPPPPDLSGLVANPDDDDVQVLEPEKEGGGGEGGKKEEEPTAAAADTSMASSTEGSAAEEAAKSPATPASRRVSLGTPVLQRANLGAGMKRVPSLDNFAVGIVPFHVDEPTPRTGFLQKMLKKIKDTLG